MCGGGGGGKSPSVNAPFQQRLSTHQAHTSRQGFSLWVDLDVVTLRQLFPCVCVINKILQGANQADSHHQSIDEFGG